MILILIAVTVMLSAAAFGSRDVMNKMIFNPFMVYHNREQWRFITSGFIHADWIHLLVNMFVFYSFGEAALDNYKNVFAERGEYYFLLLYFGGMVTANISSYKKNRDNPEYNSLGASGAVSAVVFAFIVFQPLTKLCLYGIFCLPGIIMGVLYLVYSFFAAKQPGQYINHEAHLWGAVFGFVFTLAMKPELFSNFLDAFTQFMK